MIVYLSISYEAHYHTYQWTLREGCMRLQVKSLEEFLKYSCLHNHVLTYSSEYYLRNSIGKSKHRLMRRRLDVNRLSYNYKFYGNDYELGRTKLRATHLPKG